mmetsp:Transcript_16550/g.45069  ORF Transcript_16550/g.45069 Transcript_16550/m.45069 type:complete len:346 (-) Transcript_16550:1915-2952(-)
MLPLRRPLQLTHLLGGTTTLKFPGQAWGVLKVGLVTKHRFQPWKSIHHPEIYHHHQLLGQLLHEQQPQRPLLLLRRPRPLRKQQRQKRLQVVCCRYWILILMERPNNEQKSDIQRDPPRVSWIRRSHQRRMKFSSLILVQNPFPPQTNRRRFHFLRQEAFSMKDRQIIHSAPLSMRRKRSPGPLQYEDQPLRGQHPRESRSPCSYLHALPWPPQLVRLAARCPAARLRLVAEAEVMDPRRRRWLRSLHRGEWGRSRRVEVPPSREKGAGRPFGRCSLWRGQKPQRRPQAPHRTRLLQLLRAVRRRSGRPCRFTTSRRSSRYRKGRLAWCTFAATKSHNSFLLSRC